MADSVGKADASAPVPREGCCKAGRAMKRAKGLRLAALALGGAVLLSGWWTRDRTPLCPHRSL